MKARVWRVPAERFKSDGVHVVPLSDAAMQLIKELPSFGEFLFTLNGVRPINSFSKSKGKLDELMKLSDWRVHDLRRVVRSRLAALQVSDLVAEMVLGHGKRGLQRVYDQHQYETELREALELWARHLHDLVTTPPPNVVKLPRRKRSA